MQFTKAAAHATLTIEDADGNPVQIPAPPATRDASPAAAAAPAAAALGANGGQGRKASLCARAGRQLRDELHEYGRVVATAFQPGQGRHWILFSPTFAAVLCCVWAAMTAFLPAFLVRRNLGRCEAVALTGDYAAW